LIFKETLRSINPFLLGELTKYFVNPSSSPLWYPYLCATLLTLSSLIFILLDTWLTMVFQVMGWNARSAVVGLMYDKVSLQEIVLIRYRYSFICQSTSTRRQQSDLFDLRVKLPSVTTTLTTQRQRQSC